MSRWLTIIFSCILTHSVLAQNGIVKWQHLFAKSVDANFYLVEESSYNYGGGDIIRKLDAHFLIVKVKEGGKPPDSYVPINDEWKSLNFPKKESSDSYYIVSEKKLNWERFPNANLISNYRNIYLIEAPVETIQRLIKHNQVIGVYAAEAKPHVEARVLDMNLNPNRINRVHNSFPELDGQGMLVSIQENEYRTDDVDLLGRNLSLGLGSGLMDNHATEMATIIAGAGNSFVTGRGVVRKTSISTSDFSDILPDADLSYQANAIVTQNHSYGTTLESFYGPSAAAFDQSAINNPHLLHVFSSGNQGLESPSDGTYANISGFANLTGNFKMAKNALVVGSVDTVGNTIPFTSKGPAYDGRVKPEVVAYSVVGSSNSAALVSGISTVLQQYYRSQFTTDLPSALNKALLINGSEDVGLPGLDFETGYGNVNAYRSLMSLQRNQTFTGSVVQGEVTSFNITLPETATNLKVTLCWIDPAANVGDFQALINDLDLQVVDPVMQVTLPWVLDPSPQNLAEEAVRGIDRLNNVEQVTLEGSLDLDYAIQVSGFDIIGDQEFYIVYQYEEEDAFEWDYPTASDNMPYNGESGSYFRWHSTRTEGTGELSYSIDNGTTWELLDANVNLSLGYWRWDVPPDMYAKAIARMIVGTSVFETEDFTISRPLEINVGFVCTDSARLEWPAIEGISQYEIETVGDSELELYQSIADTSFVISDTSQLNDNRFSITPVLADGKRLISSQTLDYTQQAIGCYVFSFFQEVALDTGIYLNLELGTTYGIDQLVFQRLGDSGFETFEIFENPTQNSIRVLDRNPSQGNNTHRLIIDFINDQHIELTINNTYYLTELPILVFPNPVTAGVEVNVLTKELDTTLPLLFVYDSNGKKVASISIVGGRGSVPTLGLEAGIYYYELVDGTRNYSGKLIVR